MCTQRMMPDQQRRVRMGWEMKMRRGIQGSCISNVVGRVKRTKRVR